MDQYRDEETHARLVKERIETLNSDVVNADYQNLVNKFKTNTEF